MDLQTLAATALSTLTPFLLQGAGGIAGGALESIGQQLWELVRQPFTKDRDRILLEKLREQPNDPDTRGAVRYQLAGFLEDQPELAAQLEALLDKAEAPPAAGPVYVTNSTNTVVGSTIRAGGSVRIGSGNVTLNHE